MDERCLEELLPHMDALYTFALLARADMESTRDYGGNELTMAETHTLILISDHPGISLGGVARMWNRTLGAASRNVDKLFRMGYVTKDTVPGDRRTLRLTATPAGAAIAAEHKVYDRRQVAEHMGALMEKHPPEEIRAFFAVMEDMIELMKERKEESDYGI